MPTGYVYPNEVEIGWSLLIVIYPFITGLVAGAFVVSSLYHVFNVKALKPVASFSLLAALAFLLVAPMALQAHLGRPERAFQIFLTPNPTSAMAGFGYIWMFYTLLVVAEIWLVFRPDIIHYARTATGPKRLVYQLLTLGVTDMSAEAKETDHKLIKILATAGIPSAALLHGYVGFLFGAIKANPWWSTPLMPVIFLLSAIVSGIALLIVMYVGVSLLRGKRVDRECVATMARFLMVFLIIDVAIELLEILFIAYEGEESWDIIRQLLVNRMPVSYLGIQLFMGSLIPLIILGSLALKNAGRDSAIRLATLAGALVLIGVFAMRWNVVIGGQMVSKSLRGFLTYTPPLGGREGILAASLFLMLPFYIFTVLVSLIPPWDRPVLEDEHEPLGRREPQPTGELATAWESPSVFRSTLTDEEPR